MRVLDDRAEAQLATARDVLAGVRDALVEFGATPEDLGALATSIRQLDDLFLLVVVGEFNAGKSAFINALVGQPIVQEGVTPTTAHVQLLEFGTAGGADSRPDGVRVLRAPVELLRTVHIVDTPGTNAIIRE